MAAADSSAAGSTTRPCAPAASNGWNSGSAASCSSGSGHRSPRGRRRRRARSSPPPGRSGTRRFRMSVRLSRAAYAGHYGPTAGDRVRLADTDIIIEIEKDYTVYGDEVQFGGGKVIRDGQGQSPLPGKTKPPPLDVVITNAVVLDHWGIVKGDIGIRGGRIVGVGKAGNPLIQP